jgi:lipopolysaccharide transport system ATP-binding protein
VRLAFAVAAHLEPDILIVDEVLAVGDASFQRKCLGKMGEVSSEGRTVLFVSHNMSAIRSLTPRAIWLDHGRIAADGDTEHVIADYLTTTSAPEEALVDLSGERFRRGAKPTTGRARFESLALLSRDGEPATVVRQDTPLRWARGSSRASRTSTKGRSRPAATRRRARSRTIGSCPAGTPSSSSRAAPIRRTSSRRP